MQLQAFNDYLEAKYNLDNRSLSGEVNRLFRNAVHAGERPLRVCDLGTGTGAMVRRVLQMVPGPLEIEAVDLEERDLREAEALTRKALAAGGLRVPDGEQSSGPAAGSSDENGLTVQDHEGRAARVWFRSADLGSSAGRAMLAGGGFDVITAHAIMDLLALRPTMKAIASGLRPGGVFYATLTYNGATTLLPGYCDRGFEEALIELYEASMDARGGSDGGRRAGARLYDAAVAAGLSVTGFGASDWEIVPGRWGYSAGEAAVAGALVEMIYAELEGNRKLRKQDLERWRDERHAQIEAQRLTVVVHHTDLLAVKPDDAGSRTVTPRGA